MNGRREAILLSWQRNVCLADAMEIDLRWTSGTFVYLSRWEYAILMWVDPQNFRLQQERRYPTDYWQTRLGMYLRKCLFDDEEGYGRK